LNSGSANWSIAIEKQRVHFALLSLSSLQRTAAPAGQSAGSGEFQRDYCGPERGPGGGRIAASTLTAFFQGRNQLRRG